VIVTLTKLWSPAWKIKETRDDIAAGKRSRTRAPIRVSRWGGKYYVIDGNHRVQEALQAGKKNIEAVVDEHVPNMNRTGGAYNSMLETAVRVDTETNPGADTPWAGPDKIIRKAFTSAKSYDIIDGHGLGDTWSSGGCWVAAEAIQQRFGGELLGIWDGRTGLTHVVVEKRGVMIDADGKPLLRAAFLKRYAKQEGLVPPVTAEAFRPSDAERGGLVHSPEAVQEAVQLLGGARANPITATPGAAWAKKQIEMAERGLAEPDPQREILLDKHIWPDGYLHLVIYRIGPDWFRWVLVERKPKKAKVVGTGDASRWHGRLEIGNSFITKPFRGYGLYPQILKEMKAAAGVPLVSATSRSKAAEASWKRMGGVKVENEDRYQLNPGKRYTFINPADVITTPDGYFVKKAALRKLQKAIYDNTGNWPELSEVEYIVNKMLAKAAHDKFTIVHGKHFKQANPGRSRRG
jgi:hypothetical protein